MNATEFREITAAIENQVGKVIVGQRDVIRTVLVAILAGGHTLLEGVPGLGKTMLIRTLSEVLELEFSRIQFTPDLMPSDITGTDIMEEAADGRRAFRFQRGPVFASLVLADEINRATPKTQSAMLEAMQEKTVTVANETYQLPRPFFVLATQNPLEMEGTYPLPEAQLDRFLFKVDVKFPTADELTEILARTTGGENPTAQKAASGEQLVAMQALARQVPCADQCPVNISAVSSSPPILKVAPRPRFNNMSVMAPAHVARRHWCWGPRLRRCSTAVTMSALPMCRLLPGRRYAIASFSTLKPKPAGLTPTPSSMI